MSSLTTLRHVILRFLGKRHPPGQRFYLVVINRNHVRILKEAGSLLREAGRDCVFVQPETEIQSDELLENFVPIGINKMVAQIRHKDLIVLCCDWAPPELKRALRVLKYLDVQYIGVAEGVRYENPSRYRRVERFLSWGPAAAEALKMPVHVVGSPVIEAILDHKHQPEAHGFALINYKFKTAQDQDTDGHWLQSTRLACREVGLRCVISVHPSDPAARTEIETSPKELRELLPRASVLVTRGSATVFEALALGLPVVLYPFGDEDLIEMAAPDGAYEIVLAPKDLAPALRRAIEPNAAREIGRHSFLEKHLSIDPSRSASRRIAESLMVLADGRSPNDLPGS